MNNQEDIELQKKAEIFRLVMKTNSDLDQLYKKEIISLKIHIDNLDNLIKEAK